MSQIVIDLTNYKDRFGSRVEEGTYLVQVEDLESSQSKAGNPMINVFLRIIEGEEEGKTLVDRLTLSENAMFRVVGFLTGLGIKTPRKRIAIDPARIIGRKVIVEVADGEPYNGNVRSEVKSYSRVKVTAAETENELDGLGEEVEQSAPSQAPEPVEASVSETVDDADIDLEDIDL